MNEIYYAMTDIVNMIDESIASLPSSFYCGIMAIRGNLATLPKAKVRSDEDEGEWEIVHGVCTPGGDPWLICPFCHSSNSEHLGGIEQPKRWNYCPVCGKKLSGDGHFKRKEQSKSIKGDD